MTESPPPTPSTPASAPTSTSPARNPVSPDRVLPPFPAHWGSLPRAFLHAVKKYGNRRSVYDSTRTELSYNELLLRCLALGRLLKRILGPERYVGVMLPPLAPTATVNLALTLQGKIAINLNYTASTDVVNSSIRQCGIRQVITSRKALERFGITPEGELLYLEDFPKAVTTLDKIFAGVVSKLPLALQNRILPGTRKNLLDEVATVIFTSGSTGDPKGVALSHRNVLSNVHAVGEHLHFQPVEVLLGILPFFHSMGYTVTLWTAQLLGISTVFHFNPLDARIIGELCEREKVTILIGTPTFMRSYLHRCTPEQFQTVRLLVLGAEKLKPELARDIREKLKIVPLEGYGCTELSPVVAVSVPFDVTTLQGKTAPGNREGSVGMLLPGTTVRCVDPETLAVLPRGTEGVVQVYGPQVMMGYLNRPEATAAVIHDGWYHTGDLGYQDEDGFLRITDRLSRFAKIGGEMVPHLKVESALMAVTGLDEQKIAVTSIPDAKRGERLIVLATELPATPREIVDRLDKEGEKLPRLWLPSPQDFHLIPAMPMLGSGKIDLRQLRQLAVAAASPAPNAAPTSAS